MPKQIRRSQAEIVGTFTMDDIEDMTDLIYQPTVYRAVKVYGVGEGFMCAPPAGRKPPEPEHFGWRLCGEIYGRPIYESTDVED